LKRVYPPVCSNNNPAGIALQKFFLARKAARQAALRLVLFAPGLILLALAGCLPDPATPAALLPTATATITPTVTATIVWFPATATFTPAPTQEQQPTPDLRPALGSILLEDPFFDKTHWPTSRTEAGSVAYGVSDLTLAVSQAKAMLVSMRKGPALDNFYLKIDVQPGLCSGEDEYGLLLRASSAQDFYRLLVTCSGRIRLERLKGGRVLPLQDWLPSGQLPPGGLMRSTLQVWAQGADLRVFINDVYQFSVRDPVWASGMIGVFARSAGDLPLTVSFSNLVVYQAGPARLLPTLTPTIQPTPTSTRRPTATTSP
jgi:hypothetical protein